MRVLVADRLPEPSLDEIRALGVDLVYEPELSPDLLRHALEGVGVLIVRGTPVPEEAIEAARALALIVRAGAGAANIDVAAASRRGIYVATCPGKNASAVAELAFLLIASLDRRVPDAVASLRAGRWEKDEYAQAVGLKGRTLGIAGVGHVGRAMIRFAQALEMNVVGWSRSLGIARAAELGIARVDRLEQLAERSDVLSLHLELNDRTRACVGRRVLEALPPGASLVNTARAELIDWDALAEVAPRRHLRLGFDVLPGEPAARSGEYSHPALAQLSEGTVVYATPHIGASTDTAQLDIATECVRILRSFMVSGEVPNVVNIAVASRARYQLVVRFRDKVGALANVLGVLKRHGLNVQELDNTVFEGGRAGCAKIRLDTRPAEACLQEIMAFSDEVIHVQLVQLPNLA
ncbi:MAG: D-3-phosphoglycerate dehydrogenase [Polyangiaceae bacterium]|nr:D-3-phosphoglycerate dehydrogenase [Polyangiaceae bacterium]